jgi:hypothetical protein
MYTKPIGKSTFDCLANLKEKQHEKLSWGLLSKTITFKERLMKGGKPNLKSMYEFTRRLSKRL